jgi:hypothetical protein
VKVKFAVLTLLCALAVYFFIGVVAPAIFDDLPATSGSVISLATLLQWLLFSVVHLAVSLTVASWVGLRRVRLFWTAVAGAAVAEALFVVTATAGPAVLDLIPSLRHFLGVWSGSAWVITVPAFWAAAIVFVTWLVARASRHAEQAHPADGVRSALQGDGAVHR